MMARKNMSTGPITQFSSKDIERIRVFLKTFGNMAKLTFAKGGYIIRISPMARRILVLPLLKEFMRSGTPGKK